jgi:nicotinamide mononucleotide transporter
MSIVEWFAAFLGLISVWLVVKRNVLAFPIGIVMVLIYAWIFYGVRLYSDMLLQFFFAVMQVHGWIEWTRSTQQQRQGKIEAQGEIGISTSNILDETASISEKITVLRLNAQQWGWTLIILVLGTLALGWLMGRYTQAALPYLDAFAAVQSMLAQWWMNRRYLDNWLLWIAVDVLYVYIYLDRQLYPTAGLYVVFTVMAVLGLLEWHRAWKQRNVV